MERSGRRVARIAVPVAVVVAFGGVAGYLALRGHGPTAPVAKASRGDLMGRVEDLVRSMPLPGSDAYEVPSASDREAMSRAFRLVQEGDLGNAAAVARPLGYEVRPFTDTATGTHLVLLQRVAGHRSRGWGLFVWSPGSSSRLVVEVAHPLDDIDTPPVGVETFRVAGARALLVAGASRFAGTNGSADVAHAPETVFEAVHRTLVDPRTVVFEPHGFEAARHADYGDVVVSSGAFPPGPAARAVAAALTSGGLTVCLYDGLHCSMLGGTTNVQGASTRAAGGEFLHVEMAPFMRADPKLRAQVAAAVAGAIRSG